VKNVSMAMSMDIAESKRVVTHLSKHPRLIRGINIPIVEASDIGEGSGDLNMLIGGEMYA
jgi:hypothetical protein